MALVYMMRVASLSFHFYSCSRNLFLNCDYVDKNVELNYSNERLCIEQNCRTVH